MSHDLRRLLETRRLVERVFIAGGEDIVLSTPPTRTDGNRIAVNQLGWERVPPTTCTAKNGKPTGRSIDR